MSGKRVLCRVLNSLSAVSSRCSCVSSRYRAPAVDCSQQIRQLATTNVDLCGKFVTNPSDLSSQEQADELIRRLKKEEINLLRTAIEHFQSHADKADFEGLSRDFRIISYPFLLHCYSPPALFYCSLHV